MSLSRYPNTVRRSLRALTGAMLLGILSACASDDSLESVDFEQPDTAITYTAEISGLDEAVIGEKIDELMEQSLALFRQQEDGAHSVAFLRRRAQGDVDTAKKIMRSFGYYEAEVEVDVTAPENTEDGIARAELTVDPGRLYTMPAQRGILTETGEGPPPPELDPRALGSPIGGGAAAKDILEAEQNALSALLADGRYYARQLGRDAVADPEAATIEVETIIAVGNQYRFGDVEFEGNDSVETEYLRSYIPWDENTLATPARLSDFQRSLIDTGLFNVGAATLPETPPTGDVAPVIVTLEEAPPRTITGGIRYDTDAGPAVRGGFEHRNLFGENETIEIEALVGLEEQSLENRYRVPQFWQPDQDLVIGFDIRRIRDDAFDELGTTLGIGLERKISRKLTVGAGGLVEVSQLDDGTGTEVSYLFGLPVFAAFDSTKNRLDPSKGVRARASVTPFSGVVGDTPAAFTVLDATASTYFDLSGDRKYILAARGRLGSILSGNLNVVAPNRRLYSGGGGSVRGYRERFIGPTDANGDPVGGLSVAEAGLELRTRVSDSIGLATFIEAGTVSTEIFPALDEGVQFAVGGGVRYFSPVGPLRLDVGVPINPRAEDDAFQVYLSIGQAF